MYRKRDAQQMEFERFYLPFSGKLRSDNRWVKLARLIPWHELEERYAALFSESQGAPAKSFRMALGALIIKERLAITDEETVEQIRENPYLQNFIGMDEYRDAAPFDPSMMVHFRQRITVRLLAEINALVLRDRPEKKEAGDHDDDDHPAGGTGTDDRPGSDEPKETNGNRGILMVDASVAPADITYPTDLNLLNESREKLERIIDTLHETRRCGKKKPRTYRRNARRDYLRAAKLRKMSAATLRKALGKQLRYVRRDLGYIEAMVRKDAGILGSLSVRQYRALLVTGELFRQQSTMYRKKCHSIEDRIVSISQPHVRPIVRGKASASTEFGMKIVLSRDNGYHLLEYFSWDNFNESTLLRQHIEQYRERNGHYPEAVLADKLYRNLDNIRWCKEQSIRLSGPRLGRPSRTHKDDARQEKRDASMRNAIEGSFGVAKRRYGMNRLMAKLSSTSESVIGVIVLLMNLEKLLKAFFVSMVIRILKGLSWLKSPQLQGF